MSKPFLARFAECRDEAVAPTMRCNLLTQTSEVLRDNTWISSLENEGLTGSRGTKTAVKSESTDYR